MTIKNNQIMRIKPGTPAPAFKVKDVFGHDIDLAASRGKRIYLSFERNAGCPVCNLRVHELLKHHRLLTEDAVVVLVYESPVNTLLEYLDQREWPFHFVSDPENILYRLYSVERSWSKVLSGVVRGTLGKVSAGNKLFRRPMVQDGHLNTIPAEFLIDESGLVISSHYGAFVGDHLPVQEVLSTLAAPAVAKTGLRAR